MNLIIIKDHSVYMDDEYPHNFRKLYKGITVRCTKNDNDSPQHCWFTIKTNKARTAIIKSLEEKLKMIIFNNSECKISCVFERNKNNKFPDFIVFTPDEYNELKETIPVFLDKCGCSPLSIDYSEELDCIFLKFQQ